MAHIFRPSWRSKTARADSVILTIFLFVLLPGAAGWCQVSPFPWETAATNGIQPLPPLPGLKHLAVRFGSIPNEAIMKNEIAVEVYWTDSHDVKGRQTLLHTMAEAVAQVQVADGVVQIFLQYPAIGLVKPEITVHRFRWNEVSICFQEVFPAPVPGWETY